MAVFEQAHQDAIDRINHDGWHYLAGRIGEINEEFGGHGGVIGSQITIQVNGVEVAIERGDPEIEWRLVRRDLNRFTQGFKLSVGADESSSSNRVKCKPIDWYMLCISLKIGLNMAQLGMAGTKVDYAAN